MKTYRRRRPIPRVDMTPFVSVALLLITFFVGLKMLQRPNALVIKDIGRPGKHDINQYPKHVCMIYLQDEDQIKFLQYHHGSELAEIVATSYGTSGLRRLLHETLKQAGSEEELAIVIKPTDKANLRNIVNVLNELKIAGNLPYLFNHPLLSNEKRMLADYDRFRQTNSKIPMYVSAQPSKQDAILKNR
ncbi:biopolymer transporter ExbD [Spirosoma fluminis]